MTICSVLAHEVLGKYDLPLTTPVAPFAEYLTKAANNGIWDYPTYEALLLGDKCYASGKGIQCAAQLVEVDGGYQIVSMVTVKVESLGPPLVAKDTIQSEKRQDVFASESEFDLLAHKGVTCDKVATGCVAQALHYAGLCRGVCDKAPPVLTHSNRQKFEELFGPLAFDVNGGMSPVIVSQVAGDVSVLRCLGNSTVYHHAYNAFPAKVSLSAVEASLPLLAVATRKCNGGGLQQAVRTLQGTANHFMEVTDPMPKTEDINRLRSLAAGIRNFRPSKPQPPAAPPKQQAPQAANFSVGSAANFDIGGRPVPGTPGGNVINRAPAPNRRAHPRQAFRAAAEPEDWWAASFDEHRPVQTPPYTIAPLVDDRENQQVQSTIESNYRKKDASMKAVKTFKVSGDTVAPADREIVEGTATGALTRSLPGGSGVTSLAHMAQGFGLELPCHDIPSTVRTIIGVLDGHTLHPKRFGDQTMVNQTRANGVLTLTEDNYVKGNTLIAFTPVLKAHKGAFLIQMPGGDLSTAFTNFDVSPTPSRTLIGAIAPDKDSEKLGVALNNLYCKLSTAIPTVVGGTEIATSQITQEMGEVPVNPMMLVSGKMASVATMRNAEMRLIGTENHSVSKFTANVPTNQVRTFNAYERLNENIIRTKAPVLSGANSTVEPGQMYVMYFPFTTGTDSAVENGFALGFGVFNVPFLVTAFFPPQTLWSLEDSAAIPRHFLWGDFTMEVSNMIVSMPPSGAGAPPVFTTLIAVLYSDGDVIQSEVTSHALASENVANSNFTINHDFTTDGPGSPFRAKEGVPIANISLLASASVPMNIIPSGGGVHLRFHEIPSTTTYLATVITGAQPGSQLNLSVLTHTEIKVDLSTEIAQFLDPTPDLPYYEGFLPEVLMMMERTNFDLIEGEVAVPGDGEMEAATAGARFRKVMKKIGTRVVPVVANVATNVAQRRLLAASEDEDWFAATFSSGNRTAINTGLSFPITEAQSDGSYLVKKVDVLSGKSAVNKAPDFVGSLTKHKLYPSFINWRGRSAELAFLLAALQREGWPVVAGCFSGQIDNLYSTRMGRVQEVTFTISPIALGDIKNKAFQECMAFTPDGVERNGKTTKSLEIQSLFPRSSIQAKVEPGGDGSFHVSIKRDLP